jgi:regulator of sirC expression with transglutaminase-like and TPR domain
VTTTPPVDAQETHIPPLPGLSGELGCALKQFEEEVRKPDGEIDLARAAALLALHAQPDMDSSEAILRPLARLGEAFQSHAATVLTSHPIDDTQRQELLADELCSFLASEGFKGCSEEDYHNAANSRIDKVLETRVGIPLTLSLVYMEVGQAAGLQLQGLNFPGHFLLGFGHGPRAGLLDAFKNRTTNEKEVGEMMATVPGMPIQLDSSWRRMRRMPKKIFLQRMVKNLQNSYQRIGDFSQASLMAQYGSRITVAAEIGR